MHLPDTPGTLSEGERILKAGGIISSRELIVDSSFLDPSTENTGAAWATFANPLEANGGRPQMGGGLKNKFIETGFSDITATASFAIFSAPEDVAFLHVFVDDWFYSPTVIEVAAKYGLATQQQFDQWRREHDEWKSHVGAVGALAFREAIAVKPSSSPKRGAAARGHWAVRPDQRSRRRRVAGFYWVKPRFGT